MTHVCDKKIAFYEKKDYRAENVFFKERYPILTEDQGVPAE
jgi:hypothetical protein